MKRILANWYYHRPDLTKHLLEISEGAEIIFIYKFHKPEEDERKKLGKENVFVIYWGDFKSPYQLLDTVRPDLVIFNDIEAFNQLALNIAARNRGITTYVLQHGLRGCFEVDDALQHASTSDKMELSSTSRWTLSFLLRSLQLKNLPHFFRLLKFIISRKRNELTVALYKNQFELRRADKYIEFSRDNSGYHEVRDGVPPDRFILIGNPSFDDFFGRIKNVSPNTERPYALLIDSPFCEAVLVQKERMSMEEKNNYLDRLNNYCLLKGWKFFIKLHPLTYKVANLYQHSNIEYYREADTTELIGRAQEIFLVHFSTLAPLVMSQRPFFYFDNGYTSLHSFVTFHKLIYHNLLDFDPSVLADTQPSSPLTNEELEKYLFSMDGKANHRLRKILLS